MLKISAISLVLRTRDFNDIFNQCDEIYLESPQKFNILCVFSNLFVIYIFPKRNFIFKYAETFDVSGACLVKSPASFKGIVLRIEKTSV